MHTDLDGLQALPSSVIKTTVSDRRTLPDLCPIYG